MSRKQTSQSDFANRLYNGRAHNYDQSHHSHFVERFADIVPLRRGDSVLDLACGTGLSSFAIWKHIAAEGASVIGIDVSSGMFAEAEKKLELDDEADITFYKHDVLDLDSLPDLEDRMFDVITIVSAFVLFPDPLAALRHWTKFLVPGGILALDVTHPQNIPASTALERVSLKMNVPIGYNREWSQSAETLRSMLVQAGLEVEKIEYISFEGWGREGNRHLDADSLSADRVFKEQLARPVGTSFLEEEKRNPGFLERARELFRQEWAALAVPCPGGEKRIEEVDGGWVGVCRKSN